MKISKHIMNPARIKQLQIIKDAGETNANLVCYRSGNKRASVDLSLQRFSEHGLIKFTGGGYFKITELGEAYLKQLEGEGTPILTIPVSEYEKEKYKEAVKYVQTLGKGEGISVSMIQRKIRTGYGLATVILQTLLKDGHIQSYKQWVGSSVNVVKQQGQYLRMFKTM